MGESIEMKFKQIFGEVVFLTEVAQIRAQYGTLDNSVNFVKDRAFLEQLSCYCLRQKLKVTDVDYLSINV